MRESDRRLAEDPVNACSDARGRGLARYFLSVPDVELAGVDGALDESLRPAVLSADDPFAVEADAEGAPAGVDEGGSPPRPFRP